MQILLADDHAMVREALMPFVKRVAENATVIEAENFHEAVERAKEADNLGLIILDLMMPGMDDVTGLKHINSLYPDIPTVILSGSMNVRTIRRTIKNGAAGFIPKTYGGEALISALRLVLSGECYLPSSMFLDDGDMHSPEGGTREILGDALLTPSEQETADLLKEGNSNKEIARILGVQEVTIKKRLGRIYKKLGVSNRTQATRAVLELGAD